MSGLLGPLNREFVMFSIRNANWWKLMCPSYDTTPTPWLEMYHIDVLMQDCSISIANAL